MSTTDYTDETEQLGRNEQREFWEDAKDREAAVRVLMEAAGAKFGVSTVPGTDNPRPMHRAATVVPRTNFGDF